MVANWSLNRKLITAFVGLALAMVTVGGICYATLVSVVGSYSKIVTYSLPNILALSNMRSLTRRLELGYAILGFEGNSPEAIHDAREHITEARSRYAVAEKAYLDVPFGPGEEELYKAQKAWADKAENATHELDDLLKQATPESRRAYIRVFNETYTPLAKAHVEALQKLVSYHDNIAEASSQTSQKIAKEGIDTAEILNVVAFFSALFAGLYIARTLSRQLCVISRGLSENATRVATHSQEVSSTAGTLSAGATEQAAALQETAAAIDQISAMVKKNADNAERSRDVSGKSQESAVAGKSAVHEMLTAIEQIDTSQTELMGQIEKSNHEMSEIVHVINEIATKTNVINDIVFQTKLLSFNASVEAARAGEQGKGFAVVAEEVGNLAQMSGNAAQEIAGMVSASVQKVEAIVSATRERVERLTADGRQKLAAGVEIARTCESTLEMIVENVELANQLVAEIAEASGEQAKGVSEITKAMAQLDTSTQSNATAAEQSSSVAGELASEADDLRAMVSDLLRTLNGAAAADLATPAPGPNRAPMARSKPRLVA